MSKHMYCTTRSTVVVERIIKRYISATITIATSSADSRNKQIHQNHLWDVEIKDEWRKIIITSTINHAWMSWNYDEDFGDVNKIQLGVLMDKSPTISFCIAQAPVIHNTPQMLKRFKSSDIQIRRFTWQYQIADAFVWMRVASNRMVTIACYKWRFCVHLFGTYQN